MNKVVKTIRTLVFLAVVAVLILGGLALVRRKKQQLKQAPKYGLAPRPVTVHNARPGTLLKKRHYLAVVEPEKRIQVAARVTAGVDEVLCDEGVGVREGEVLLKLDARDVKHRIAGVEARIEQAEAQLAASNETAQALEGSLRYFKAEAQRYSRLAGRDAVPVSQAEKAEEKKVEIQGRLNAARETSAASRHRIKALEKQRDELSTQLGFYTIKSPVTGIVADRMVEPGELAVPGKALLQLEDRDTMKLAFDVPQSDLADIREGLPIRFSGPTAEGTAEIGVLHPSFDRARMRRAEAQLSPADGKELVSGAYVSVSVLLEDIDEVILVPLSAVIESPEGTPHVFVVDDGHLAAHAVELLGFTDGQAAVEGIPAGTPVVENTFLGWARLSAGEKVEAVR